MPGTRPPFTLPAQRPLVLLAALAALGAGGAIHCGSSTEATCGPGAGGRDGNCVASGGAGGKSGASGAGTGPAAGSGSGAGGSAGGGGGGPPTFPETIDRLSIAVRTGTGQYDGDGVPDDKTIELCLTESDCFLLDVADDDDGKPLLNSAETKQHPGDRAVGGTDVYHFAGVGLPRSKVDRVELRTKDGKNAWRPACVEVRFDGEPVHCEDKLDVVLGDTPPQVMSYADPQGLHNGCNTCYPAPITHGPLVGAVGPGSTRILVRTDATRKVELRVGDLADPGKAAVVASAYPLPANDFTVVLEAGGLNPSTSYVYSFDVDGESVPGSHTFRTSPALGSKGSYRFAMGSCSRYEAQPIFAKIAEKKPDAFLFLGDNNYSNFRNIDRFRYFYRWSLERKERAALAASTPTLAIWDDHDFLGNNSEGFLYGENIPDPRRDLALQVFEEYWANASYGTKETPGIFSKWSWGDVDVFLLDCRYHRNKNAASLQFLGKGQNDWLRAELQASKATFKMLACGSVWIWPAQGSDDSWRLYKAERDALLDFIRDEKIDGVVLASGDIHKSRFARVLWKAKGGYDFPELTSSGLATNGGGCPQGPFDVSDGASTQCVSGTHTFMTLDFDTQAADPSLVAKIFDVAGVEREQWKILRSSLTNP